MAQYDVIIIGAGAAGLMASWELALTGKTVCILEAKEKTGGRIRTIEDERFESVVELGAEFVHGDLELTEMIFKKAKIEKHKVRGSIWQKHKGQLEEQKDFIEDFSKLNKKLKEVKNDISVAEFFGNYLQGDSFEELRFSLKNYVEGYYAADITKASTMAMCEELNNSDEKQYRVEGGYIKLINFLEEQCMKNHVEILVSHPVTEVKWSKDLVEVISHQESFTSTKLLTTISVGLLQTESIKFSPALPRQMSAARALGFGPVVKTILQFDKEFWKDSSYTEDKKLDDLGFMFSAAEIPTWWTYYPQETGMLAGWSGGRHAEKIKTLTDEEIIENAIDSLTEIFDIRKEKLRGMLIAWQVGNWPADPYTLGGYSYDVVNGNDAKSILKIPEENTLFFAGEGLFEGPEIGTVEAALRSGREMAHVMISSFV
ncbi:MAG: flavin monoamine oxidase family protein [Flavisolibacter sp.]